MAVCEHDALAWKNEEGSENSCHIDIWLMLMASAVVELFRRAPKSISMLDNDSG